jgi:hypothetical protein
MNRNLPNMPLAVDPASQNQPNINRQLTEAIRQLWLRENDSTQLLDLLERRVKTLEIKIPDSLPANLAYTDRNNNFAVLQTLPGALIGNYGAGNYSEFEADGTLEMHGDATVWDDLRIEPVVKATGTNDPTFTQWFTNGAGSRGVYLYNFTNDILASEKEVFYTVQLPHSWAQTAIYLHAHWISDNSQATAAVRWGLEYTWANVGQVFGNTTIIYSSTPFPADVNLVQYKHYKTQFAAITPTASQNGISSILICRLFRNSSHADDTFTGIAGLLYADVHFELNTIGSRTELTK